LEELAQQVCAVMGNEKKSITKQALSKYELGKMLPSPQILNALGVVFGVKGAYLLKENTIEVQTIAYRRKPTMTQREEEYIHAQVRLRMEIGLRLQCAFDEMSVLNGLKEYPVASLSDVECAAERLRHDWELGNALIANMTDLLEAHCIHVLVLPFDFGSFEGLSSWIYEGGNKMGAAVAVRTGITVCRHRFTLAHELGHLILRCAPLFENEESACYRFAGALLVPAETLRKDFGSKKRTVTLDELLILKQRYLVSMQCVLHRLLELELLSPSHYQEWRTRIKKEEWEMLEPGDEKRNETAALTSLKVRRGLNEGLINKSESGIYLGEQSWPQVSSFIIPSSELKDLTDTEIEEMNAYYLSEESKEWEAVPN
jgi:Zn-dependent peptidase ImmA (M78 family)